MYVAPRYLGRGSWLARRDPRVPLVGLALFVFTVIQVWDLRILAGLALVAYLYYRSAAIPFSAVRAQWAYVTFFITFVVVVNTLLTGGELRGYTEDELHVFFRVPLLGTPVSAESITYAAAQYLRFGSMAAVGFPIAFAIAPGDIGPAFARLGVPVQVRVRHGADLPVRSLAGRRHAHDDRRTASARLRVGEARPRAGRAADAA